MFPSNFFILIRKYIALFFAILSPLGMKAQMSLSSYLYSLPILSNFTDEIHYQGSVDKNGGNADWDWYLYEDHNQEWVVMDVDGPGCIVNITQHRYLSCSDPLFRIYIDNSVTPSYSFHLSEMGVRFPFIRPYADCYIGPYDNGRGPIRVGRSFVPIPFSRHCKVTTDVKLAGNNPSKNGSGWGHIIYHSYAEPGDCPFGVPHENIEEARMLKTSGARCVGTSSTNVTIMPTTTLAPNSSCQLFSSDSIGMINGITLYTEQIDEELLQSVWMEITFDGHDTPDVFCPIGSFFGNGLGINSTEYLLMGVSQNGVMYNTFPMPFWHSAKARLVNKGNRVVSIMGRVENVRNPYDEHNTGYFRNTPYCQRIYTKGRDTQIASINGSGKVVAVNINCWAHQDHTISCEGDVHIYIDDEKTPRVLSDGSESYVSYGWGFPTPPETTPFGGYDGVPDNPWSMTKLCVFDSYMFRRNFKFFIESGEHNDQYLEHSGTVFYYGCDRIMDKYNDSLNISDIASLKKHHFKVIGEHMMRNGTSSYFGTYENDTLSYKYMTYASNARISFVAKIEPSNKGVRLLRTSCQLYPQQRAEVWVDGVRVTEKDWYHADNNKKFMWLDDSFVIPQKYTKGKNTLKIEIRPQSIDGNVAWTDSRYQIYSICEYRHLHEISKSVEKK